MQTLKMRKFLMGSDLTPFLLQDFIFWTDTPVMKEMPPLRLPSRVKKKCK